MKTSEVRIEVVDDVVVSHATRGTLSDDDLQRIVSACCASNVRKYLSITDGEIVVNAKQRAEAKKLAHVQIVAVIDSPLMRGVITALSWFGVKVSAFAPNQLEQAIDRLEVSRTSRARIVAWIAGAANV